MKSSLKFYMKGKNIKIMLISMVFILGFLYIITYKHSDLIEGFDLQDKCPNLLIKKGKELHLVNTKKALVPGVNPIKFNNLEEYSEFVKYQQYLGIKCPILYYQETYDTQNSKGYRMMNNPFDPKNGLPSNLSKNYNVTNSNIPTPNLEREIEDASRDNPPYNEKHYMGIDVTDQLVGVKTELDKINLDSVNPMSSFWKGDSATKESIERGDFVGRTRSLNNPFEEKALLKKPTYE